MKKQEVTSGIRVRRHSFVGSTYRAGFVGVVIGWTGRTPLVLGDDGLEWNADVTELTLDGERSHSSVRCSCCVVVAKPEQLTLFDWAA
jgi:hypothetical protein